LRTPHPPTAFSSEKLTRDRDVANCAAFQGVEGTPVRLLRP
jgi:hypothetical protein